MPRLQSLIAATLLATLAVAGSACGVLAETTVATVSGRSVSLESVEELARDEGFSGSAALDEEQGRLEGDQFRNMLLFQLERVAWVAEAQRWGVQVDAQAARSQLDEQLSAQGLDWQPSTRAAYAEYLAAQTALQERFAQLDPSDESVLRRFYDGAPDLWDRACVAVVQVGGDQADEVAAALDDGATLEELPERVQGTSIAADPNQRCLAMSQLPPELRDAITTAQIGRDEGPVTVSEGAPGETSFVFRVDSRQRLSFDDARAELEGIVGTLAQNGPQPWINVLVQGAEIDPRVGEGVSAGQQGAVIAPPPVPISDAPVVPEMFGGTDATGATP